MPTNDNGDILEYDGFILVSFREHTNFEGNLIDHEDNDLTIYENGQEYEIEYEFTL